MTARPEYGYITRLLKRINALVSLGFGQARACEIVANTSRDKYLRDFFLRFAQSIKVGEDITEFLEREYKSYVIIYGSDYERSMVRLKRLSEAYIAVLSSTIFVSVTFALMGMLWGEEFVQALWMLMLPLMGIYGLLVFMFYQIAPYEKLVSDSHRARNIDRLLTLSKVMVIATIISLIISIFLSLQYLIPLNLIPFIALIFGVPSLTIGITGIRLIKKIKVLDEKFPPFLTTLASSISSLGASVREALKEIMRIDFGPLNKLIRSLRARLEVGIDEEICWKLFERETSSEIIIFHSEIFYDSFKAGAPAVVVGNLLGKSVLNILTLRKRREEVSAFLRSILLPLHPALAAILALTLAIITGFTESIETVQQAALPVQIITPIPVQAVEIFSYIVLFTTTIANAMVMYIIEGGHSVNLSYYLGLFLLTGCLIYFGIYNWMRIFLQSLIGGVGG